MAGNPDKIIVTNIGALKRKYGARGLAAIRRAIDSLIAADRNRGLETELIALDNRAQMRRVGGPTVTRATDPRQNKRAVDAVYRAFAPDYLVLLGSVDVVPHQNLKNTMFDPSP